MDSTITVALISGLCTLVGTLGGILASSKLTAYRIEQLEKKLDEYKQVTDQVIDRVYRLEQRDAVFEEEIKVANHRINDLEGLHK